MKKAEIRDKKSLELGKMYRVAKKIKTDKDLYFRRGQEHEYIGRAAKVGRYIQITLYREYKRTIHWERTERTLDIFIDTKDRVFETRIRENGETIWKKALIENLLDYTESIYLPKRSRMLLNTVFKSKSKYAKTVISNLQRKMNEERHTKKYREQMEEWSKEVEDVPAIPEAFLTWMKKECVQRHYILYKDAKATKGYCTNCIGEVELIKKPKHKEKGKCPTCGKEVEFISRAKKNTPIYEWSYETGVLLQKYRDGIIIRKFTINRVNKYDNFRKVEIPVYNINERERHVVNQRMTSYEFQNYKQRGTNWVKMSGTHQYNKAKVWMKTAKKVLRNINTGFLIAQENHCMCGWREIIYYLKKERSIPVIEKLYKAGIPYVANGLLQNYILTDTEIDLTQGELAKALCIDKMRMKRLKEMKGDLYTLAWLQYEKSKDIRMKDEDIELLASMMIKPKDKAPWSRKIVFDLLSESKICNYVRQQMELRDRSARNVINDWCDYIEMLKKAKIDITKELIIKPKDLTRAHNEMVARLSKKDNEQKAKEKEKQFKKAQKLLSSGALKHYEYENEKYCIVAPKGIADIFEEGVILKHCIHTCDIYFQRIEIKESFLLFLRRKEERETPWYTLEIEPGGNIRQKKSVLNETYKDLEDAIPFLKEWQQFVIENMTSTEKKLAQKSNEAREQGYRKLREEQKIIWNGRLKGTLLADALESDFMKAGV